MRKMALLRNAFSTLSYVEGKSSSVGVSYYIGMWLVSSVTNHVHSTLEHTVLD
jgi:hypothetical protein